MTASLLVSDAELPPCSQCGHSIHEIRTVDTAMGPRTSVGITCFGCPLCRKRITDQEQWDHFESRRQLGAPARRLLGWTGA